MGVALVCLTVLALWWRMEPLVRDRLEVARQRELAIARGLEAIVAGLERRTAPPPSVETLAAELPIDLRLVAEAESEEWAVLATKAEMAQLYAQATGTPEERWNRVRRSYEMPGATA